jgi:hypothetical protein
MPSREDRIKSSTLHDMDDTMWHVIDRDERRLEVKQVEGQHQSQGNKEVTEGGVARGEYRTLLMMSGLKACFCMELKSCTQSCKLLAFERSINQTKVGRHSGLISREARLASLFSS